MDSVVSEETTFDPAIPKIKEQKIKGQELSGDDLLGLWGLYAEAGYEKTDKMSFFYKARQTFENLFVPVPGSYVLDGGCGTGQTFEAILKKIHPSKIVGLDWSRSMLRKARATATKLIKPHLGYFEFSHVDLTGRLPWPDNYFDAVTSHLVMYYLAHPGWPHALREFHRVTKPGGYLYVSTLLANHDLGVLIKAKRWKLETFFRSPLGLFYGLKLKKYPQLINEVLKGEGVSYPKYNELIGLLQELGAKKILQEEIFWGAGIALRIQTHKPFNNTL